MANEFSNIIHTLNVVYGIDLLKYDEVFLKQVLEKRFAECVINSETDYIKYLADNITELPKLMSSLSITYTMFFRNPLTFAYLEQSILPRLIEELSENSELRIWSAGCSSGQEAYSIAMLIDNINAKKQKSLRYRIIATDISEFALASANKGEYTEEEVQNIRLKDIKTHFKKTGDMYTICDKLKKHTLFSNFDLLDPRVAFPSESIFGNFDLVICSNMLFYYKPEKQQFILEKLYNSMSGQGYLVTGETERQIVASFRGLHAVALPLPIFQKRNRGVR